MLKNTVSIKIKSVGQFIIPLVFIGCLFGIIYHIGVHFYGIDVILRVYGIQNENTLFDKSYKEFEFDPDDVRGDYTYEEYYLNSLNSLWIDMKIEDTI